jgi:hypothetical protein
MWSDYHAMILERTGTSTSIQAAAIQRWADDVRDQAIRAGTYNEEFNAAVEARSKVATENLKLDLSSLRDHSRATLVERAERARATYEEMIAQSGNFSDATIEEFRKTAEAAELAAANWNGAFSGAIDLISEHTAAGARQMIAEAEGVALSWEKAMGFVRDGKGTLSGTVQQGFVYGGTSAGFGPIKTATGQATGLPSFSSGVEDFKGGLAYVHKNELLVNMAPGTSVIPASRAISPTTGPAGRSGGNTYNINISAGMGSNGREIARLVKEALVDDARQQGRRV